MMTKDDMKIALQQGVCNVTFTKVNGDERVMKCTLKEDLLPAKPLVTEDAKPLVTEDAETKTKKPNPDVLAVYDVKAAGWRSFRWDSLKDFELE